MLRFFTLSSIKSFPVETGIGTSQSSNFYRTGNKYKTSFNSFISINRVEIFM